MYAEGRDLRGLVAIVGKGALSERDLAILEFADRFEERFVRQGRDEDRSFEGTLDLGWELLADLPENVLTRDERSAAYMADGYARVSGRVGVCEGPSGGGATYSHLMPTSGPERLGPDPRLRRLLRGDGRARAGPR